MAQKHHDIQSLIQTGAHFISRKVNEIQFHWL